MRNDLVLLFIFIPFAAKFNANILWLTYNEWWMEAYIATTAKAKPSLLLKGETPRLIDEWQIIPQLWDAVSFQHNLLISPNRLERKLFSKKYTRAKVKTVAILALLKVPKVSIMSTYVIKMVH